MAVVRRNSSDAFSLDELRGRRSCHSGLGSLAGWDIPVGTLTYKGLLRPRDCDVLTGEHPTQAMLCVGVASSEARPVGTSEKFLQGPET